MVQYTMELKSMVKKISLKWQINVRLSKSEDFFLKKKINFGGKY